MYKVTSQSDHSFKGQYQYSLTLILTLRTQDHSVTKRGMTAFLTQPILTKKIDDKNFDKKILMKKFCRKIFDEKNFDKKNFDEKILTKNILSKAKTLKFDVFSCYWIGEAWTSPKLIEQCDGPSLHIAVEIGNDLYTLMMLLRFIFFCIGLFISVGREIHQFYKPIITGYIDIQNWVTINNNLMRNLNLLCSIHWWQSYWTNHPLLCQPCDKHRCSQIPFWTH